MTGRPTRWPAASIARPSCGETPLIVSGASIGFVPTRRRRRIAAAARGEAAPPPAARARGGSAGLERIASIGVASATLPPYSPIEVETAPMLRCTPAASGQ